MCTRILSKVLVLTTLFTIGALGLEKAPLTQKLPPLLQDKQPLAYFSFDQKGRGLSTNQIKSPLTIQLRGVHYTPEGLDHGAVRFTGPAQVKIPLPVTTDLTFSAWFLPTGLSRQGFFSICTLQSNQHVLTINLHQNGTIQIQQTTPFSQGSSSVNTGLGIPANQWLHLALVATPQQLTLYLNGQQAGAFSMPVPLSRAHLVIAGQTYRGRIDEVALFQQSLSTQDIQALFERYKPAITPGVSEPPRADTWEAKAVRTYAELTQAINSGNWSVAAAQATAVSDLVATYLEDQKSHLAKPAQESIKTNLAKASSLVKTFHLAIAQAKYHEASDLFDDLDVLWETLEDQLSLPVSNGDTAENAPLLGSGRQQSAQFSQTWSSSSGAMPGSGFSGGMSMGGGGGFNSVSGGRFSMSSSSGPDGQIQFNSSGIPQGLMGQSMGQMPPEMMQPQILIQNQRIQMTLMALKISLQNANWQAAQVHSAHLQKLFTQMAAPGNPPLRPNARTRRRTLSPNGLLPAQQSALNTQVQNASRHLTLLNAAIEKQDLEAAYKHLQSLEDVSKTLNQRPDNAVQLPQPPNP